MKQSPKPLTEVYFSNTLSRKIERFTPIKDNLVRLYSCGPTVFDHTHLGHMRAYIFVDTLKRVLIGAGARYKAKHVMNITDVGHLFGDRDMGKDKVEAAAKRAKKSAWEIARMYEKEFFETMDALNVLRPTVVCRATEHIPQMIKLIERIEKNGFTYKTSDGIYFDTSKIADYNKLSGMSLGKLKEGARVEKNPEKKNPTDFALWKFSPRTGPRRQMEWESPWGKGFPGWHIECSAMSMKYLGERFDIHTGGVDHIPVHHTNEIAQSEAATGKSFVQYWLHNEFVLVNKQKMSKSLGNFYTMEDIIKKEINPMAVRYLFLTSHYRDKINFTWKSLKAAEKALFKIYSAGIRFYILLPPSGKQVDKIVIKQKTKEAIFKKFVERISTDLDTPEALSILWQCIRSNAPPLEKLCFLYNTDPFLGLNIQEVVHQNIHLSPKTTKLLESRAKYREAGKWRKADEIRRRLMEQGLVIEDMNGITLAFKRPFNKMDGEQDFSLKNAKGNTSPSRYKKD